MDHIEASKHEVDRLRWLRLDLQIVGDWTLDASDCSAKQFLLSA